MKLRRLLRPLALSALAPLALASAYVLADDAPDKAAVAAPAAEKSDKSDKAEKSDAKISPEAKALMDKVGEAYGKLKSLELAGTISLETDANGEVKKHSKPFTATYVAPNKFRHEMQDDVLCGLTGEKAYVFKAARNAYESGDAPKEKVATKELPLHIPTLIQMQNPSLMLALSKSPASELAQDVTDISTAEDTKVNGASCPTLRLVLKDKSIVLLAWDPETHLLRQSLTDFRAQLEAKGAADVKKALITVEYATAKPNAEIKDEQFAWAAPEGARDIKTMAHGGGGGEDSPALALEGKAAPEFKLKGLDGKEVALAELKGSVVVLDFWATWCGPCRASLPNLDKLYQDSKASGVKVFAVNQAEEKDQVDAFVKETKLTVPVLLDSDGSTGEKYLANAIPETVVIGKDGKVKKVFVGYGEDTEEQIKQIIAESMK